MTIVPLSRGYEAVIDECDADRVLAKKWSASGIPGLIRAQHYWRENGARFAIGMGPFIMEPPAGLVVDHIDHNPLNNRRGNLRVCTAKQNLQHRQKYKNNTSGFIGVSITPRHKAYFVRIRFDGLLIHVGHFADPIEAARAYDAAAVKYFGEFAVLNFPATPLARAA